MNGSYYTPQSKPSYTITNAKQDVETLQIGMAGLETTMRLLRDEVDTLRNDEWRALHFCKMLRQRVDILEHLLLLILKPESQQYLSHAVLTELRKSQSSVEVANATA